MRFQKSLSSLMLMAAVALPVALGAAPSNPRSGDDVDRDHKVHRYYDRRHRDYHEWNEHESRAYVRWEAREHRRHREYVRRHRVEQSRYWSWRHRHPDND